MSLLSKYEKLNTCTWFFVCYNLQIERIVPHYVIFSVMKKVYMVRTANENQVGHELNEHLNKHRKITGTVYISNVEVINCYYYSKNDGPVYLKTTKKDIL